MRQTMSSNRSNNSQFGPISSDPMFLQSPSALATSSIYPLLSSPSPQYSLRPSSSTMSAFNLGPINENINPAPLSMEDNNHIFNKISPLKRTRFSAESFISDACSQSAFYSPKYCKIDTKDPDHSKSMKNHVPSNQVFKNIVTNLPITIISTVNFTSVQLRYYFSH